MLLIAGACLLVMADFMAWKFPVPQQNRKRYGVNPTPRTAKPEFTPPGAKAGIR